MTGRLVELSCIVSVTIAAFIGTVTLVFWRRARLPDYSQWCGPSHRDFSINITGAPLEGDTYNWIDGGITFPPGTFWTDSDGTIFGCPCSRKRCLRKCCEKNVVFDNNSGECAIESNSTDVERSIRTVHAGSEVKLDIVDSDYFFIVHGMSCKGYNSVLANEYQPYLLDDGRVFTNRPVDTYLDQAHYCLEVFEDDSSVVIVECYEAPSQQDRWVYVVKAFGMVVSVPFLLATLLVYALVPSLRNLHGKSLMCHVSCLTVTYLTNATIHLYQHLIVEESKLACIILAYILQFSFLATFFWLNIMSFDIWRLFSDSSSVRNSKSMATKNADKNRFLIYSCYAWGGPVLISSVSALMDFNPHVPGHYIKPQMGAMGCWFTGVDAQILYLYLPIGVLLCVNLMMFITTAYRLRAHTIKVKALRNSNNCDRQRFWLYAKLFAVMGVNWMLEVVSFMFDGQDLLWLVGDLGNTLQGITIFSMFVCKNSTLDQLRERFWPKKHRSNSFSSRVTRSSNISSQAHSSVSNTPTPSFNICSQVPNAYNSNPPPYSSCTKTPSSNCCPPAYPGTRVCPDHQMTCL